MLAWEESLERIALRRRPLDDDGDGFEDGEYDLDDEDDEDLFDDEDDLDDDEDEDDFDDEDLEDEGLTFDDDE